MTIYGRTGEPLRVEPVTPVAGCDIRKNPPDWKIQFCHEFDRYTNGELLAVWDSISQQVEKRVSCGTIDPVMIEQFWPLQKYLGFKKELRIANGNAP